jgi:hypothetical protein
MQAVSPEARLELPVEDLSHVTTGPVTSEVLRRAEQEARRPFELATGPLLRARLLRLRDDEAVLLLTTHHIVSDGWSQGVFVREVAALYAARQQGRPSPLAPLTLQYPDYAVWQRKWLQGPVLEAQIAYWKRQLAGAAPVLELPTDRPRPVVQSFQGAQEPFQLSEGLTTALRHLTPGSDGHRPRA